MTDIAGSAPAEAPTAVAAETIEDVRARHRREVKELTGKVTALKKSVSGDKKKKKEVTTQIALMEAELAQRHEAELAAAQEGALSNAPAVVMEVLTEDIDAATAAVENVSLDTPAVEQGGKKKPNRQKLRKERKAQQFEEMRRQAAEEAGNMENMKEVEDAAIAQLLEPLSLAIQPIAPDGHCMYNAIAHQLSYKASTQKSYKELRHIAAEYMRTNPDDFLPFLVNNEGDMMNEAEYADYCDRVEETALWGGQYEQQALSRALNRPIHIIQMGSPILKVGEDLPGEPLMVS
ncbi:OTU domain-containing protein 6A [Rhizophlyctis rosea]|nr:OTU domain-containing protein 6A [Rhizophlyctis rosea]